MKKATIVGAGFSGLITTYYLIKKGWDVDIYEPQRIGGLISTIATPYGPAETAANGIIANKYLEEVCLDLKVELQEIKAKKPKFNFREKFKLGARYIYWNSPRRFPLSILGAIRFGTGLLFGILTGTIKPIRLESLWDWSLRNFGQQFTERVIATFPNGVYASSAQSLSAHLVIGRIFSGERIPKAKLRGTVTPKGGMGDLISALEKFAIDHGVRFHRKEFKMTKPPDHYVIICTGAHDAARVIDNIDKDLSARLEHIDLLPIVTVTQFYEPLAKEIHGFGVLFAPKSGFNSLGVLFNSDTWENRDLKRSETWILGGEQQRSLVAESNQNVLGKISQDREKLSGFQQNPITWHMTRWEKAIPKYSLELEKHLPHLKCKDSRVILNGNYLGSIGLGQILDYSRKLVTTLKELE